MTPNTLPLKRLSRWYKHVGWVLIMLVACYAAFSLLPGEQVHAAVHPATAAPLVSGSTIASIALGQVGGQCSDYYGCPDPGNWCADFARWVWQQAGADTFGLTGESGTFYLYGLGQGTLSRTPHVGDVVVFDYGINGYGTASHVAIVVAVSGSSIYSVGGNENNTVQKDGPYSSAFGTSLAGEKVWGFISPVGSSFGSSNGQEVGVFDKYASSFWIDGKNQKGQQVGHCLTNSDPNVDMVLTNWWWSGPVRIAYYSDASCTYPASYYGQVNVTIPQSMAGAHICTFNYDPNYHPTMITNC